MIISRNTENEPKKEREVLKQEFVEISIVQMSLHCREVADVMIAYGEDSVMRRPLLEDCNPGDGSGPDLECYYEAMERYEEEERDRQLEEEMVKSEKRYKKVREDILKDKK